MRPAFLPALAALACAATCAGRPVQNAQSAMGATSAEPAAWDCVFSACPAVGGFGSTALEMRGAAHGAGAVIKCTYASGTCRYSARDGQLQSPSARHCPPAAIQTCSTGAAPGDMQFGVKSLRRRMLAQRESDYVTIRKRYLNARGVAETRRAAATMGGRIDAGKMIFGRG